MEEKLEPYTYSNLQASRGRVRPHAYAFFVPVDAAALRSTEDTKLRSSRTSVVVRRGRVDSRPRPRRVRSPYHHCSLLQDRVPATVWLERNRFWRVHRNRVLPAQRCGNIEPSTSGSAKRTRTGENDRGRGGLTLSSKLPRRHVGLRLGARWISPCSTRTCARRAPSARHTAVARSCTPRSNARLGSRVPAAAPTPTPVAICRRRRTTRLRGAESRSRAWGSVVSTTITQGIALPRV